MPKQAFRAAAEGLPTINRRSLLGGMASLATAGSTVATAAVPDLAPFGARSGPQEGPGLLELGRQLRQRAEEAEAAYAEHLAAADRYYAMVPAVPDELRPPTERALTFCHPEVERDAFNNAAMAPDGRLQGMILTSYNLERAALRWPDADLYPGDHIRSLIPLAEAYEAAQEKARVTSGLLAAENASVLADSKVEKIAEAIAEIEATALHGLSIKAEAILAVVPVRRRRHMMHPDPRIVRFANSVLKLGGAST